MHFKIGIRTECIYTYIHGHLFLVLQICYFSTNVFTNSLFNNSDVICSPLLTISTVKANSLNSEKCSVMTYSSVHPLFTYAFPHLLIKISELPFPCVTWCCTVNTPLHAACIPTTTIYPPPPAPPPLHTAPHQRLSMGQPMSNGIRKLKKGHFPHTPAQPMLMMKTPALTAQAESHFST